MAHAGAAGGGFSRPEFHPHYGGGQLADIPAMAAFGGHTSPLLHHCLSSRRSRRGRVCTAAQRQTVSCSVVPLELNVDTQPNPPRWVHQRNGAPGSGQSHRAKTFVWILPERSLSSGRLRNAGADCGRCAPKCTFFRIRPFGRGFFRNFAPVLRLRRRKSSDGVNAAAIYQKIPSPV